MGWPRAIDVTLLEEETRVQTLLGAIYGIADSVNVLPISVWIATRIGQGLTLMENKLQRSICLVPFGRWVRTYPGYHENHPCVPSQEQLWKYSNEAIKSLFHKKVPGPNLLYPAEMVNPGRMSMAVGPAHIVLSRPPTSNVDSLEYPMIWNERSDIYIYIYIHIYIYIYIYI